MSGLIIDYFRRRAEALRERKETAPPDESCVFCGIVSGEGPAFVVYEDDDVIAFLDVMPICPGHTLVCPKKHYQRVSHLPDELGALIGAVLPRISRAVCSATDQPDYNIVSNQGHAQVVDHVHFHLVPAPKADGPGWGKAAAFGIGPGSRMILEDEDGEAMAKLIRSRLEAPPPRL